jgi:hypothetical protein
MLLFKGKISLLEWLAGRYRQSRHVIRHHGSRLALRGPTLAVQTGCDAARMQMLELTGGTRALAIQR